MEGLRRELALKMPGNPAIQGWASYSQCDEDGIIRECLRRIGSVTQLSKNFIEIGCGNGLENNTHQLALDGFTGCWLDGDWSNIGFISQGLTSSETPGLLVRQTFVTLESISDVIADFASFLGTQEIDFFSLDTDGNDTHLVGKALTVIRPKLICVEYNAKFRPPTRVEMQYNASHTWAGDDYFGASLQSWVDLLAGYTLVSCNLSGANAFFVRDDLLAPFDPRSAEELYQPPRYWLTSLGCAHPPSMKWLRQAVFANTIDRQWVLEGRVPGIPRFEFEIHRKGDLFISTQLARANIWEPFETEVIRRLCRRGDFVLDIGGNIGWYSVVISRVIGATGRIVTFEPDPDNFALLSRNVARCADAPQIQLRQEAVGESAGTVKLFLSDINRGDHRIFDDGTDRIAIEVPLDSLDSLLANEGRLPDLVKSDTQGSEARIIRGARGLLSSGWRPVFVLEFWPFGLSGSGDDSFALWQELCDLGYQTFEVTEEKPRLFPLSAERMKTLIANDISAASGAFINILAIPAGSDRIEGVLDLIA
jgi:FkbM family methyltransferase